MGERIDLNSRRKVPIQNEKTNWKPTKQTFALFIEVPNPKSLKTQNPNASQNLKRSRTKMAKSLRSKREKRLRAIRREIVEPLYETKDAAKLAAQEAALAAPKVPVRLPPSSATTAAMDLATTNTDSTSAATTFSFNAMGALSLSLSHTLFDLKLFDQILFFFLGTHCFESK